jgi:hypothetical protein
VLQIADWLEKLGMSEYALRFAENRIDFFALPDLTDSDLKDLGVVLGDRRKIMRAIAKLDAAPEAAVLMAKPPSTLSVAAVQSLPIAEESSERRYVTPYGSFQESGDGHPRANYHRLLARAAKGLDRNIAEARQVVYERARKALMAHLRSNQPRLLKADIVKERLAFEDAIREVEAEVCSYSAICGVARVMDIVTSSRSKWFWRPDDGSINFGWLLVDATALKQPIPCKGALGLWTFCSWSRFLVKVVGSQTGSSGERPTNQRYIRL